MPDGPAIFTRRRTLQLLGGGVAAALPGTAAWALNAPSTINAGPASQVDGFRRAQPASAGVDPQAILDLLADLERNNIQMNSFMLYRQGAVIAEGSWWPYRPELIHMMHSLTKSVTVSAIGMAIDQGKLKITDRVVSFYPDQLPPVVSNNLARMTLEDLLTMRTGHDHQTSGSEWRQIETSWVAEFYKIPVVFEPGTKWVYTSAATYMLSAIFSRVMGQSVYEYLKPRFFDPLGIHGEEWLPGPEDITPGANGLSWRCADSLKLGVLYLQDGRWNDKQILPAAWTRQCRRPYTPHYGYQWWLGPDNVAYADGLFGQLCFVWPDHDAVFACTASIQDDDDFPPILYRHFPRAFGEVGQATNTRQGNLTHKLASLRMLPDLPRTNSPTANEISGKTFFCNSNADEIQTIFFDFRSPFFTIYLHDGRATHSLKCGLGSWVESFTTMPGNHLHHEYQPDIMRVVAGARWLDAHTLEMTWSFVETSFVDTVICRFQGNSITFDRRVNVNSSARERPTVSGYRRDTHAQMPPP